MTTITSMLTSAPDLIRDPEHKYWVKIENLLGVTEVMVEVGLESDEWYTETHSSRGRAVHAELANAALGVDPFPFLDPDLVGWCKSGRDFLAEIIADGAVVLGVEVMRYHSSYRFAGTVDLIVLWRGYEWVLDWKSGKASRVTRFKLAAYDLILGSTSNGKARKRAAVEVQEDGSKAKLVQYNDVKFYHDGNRFLGYLNTARDKREFGPKRAA